MSTLGSFGETQNTQSGKGSKESKDNDEMYGLNSIWGLTERKPCSTWKVWLTGDILEGYVFFNSLVEVSKIQLSLSCTPVLVLEEEGKLAEVRFWTNQGCWSFQSTCSALSKYCKFCACTTYFGEELYRSTTSYNNLSLFVFWLWSSANQTSHGCCSAPLLSFPFTAFPKANGQMLSNNCSWNYKSDKSHQPCLKNDFNMGLVREKIEGGKGMIHTLFLLFSWHPSPSGHLGQSQSRGQLGPSQHMHSYVG